MFRDVRRISHGKWLQTAVDFCKAQNADYLPRIYTDGTYDETQFDLHSVFDTTAVRRHAAASVVIVHDGADWKDRPALSIRITDGDMIDTRSAYTMEYLALALATQIQQYSKGTGIYSDSQAVVKVIRKRQEHLSKRDCSHRMILQVIDTAVRNDASEASWIPSHAERREKRRQYWTRDEWGNHLADKVADGNVAAVTTMHPHIQWTTVAAITAMASLPGKGELYIGTTGDTQRHSTG